MRQKNHLNRLLLFVLCFSSFALSAQINEESESNLIQQKLLIEDLHFLQQNWDALHGAMYIYNSKEVIDAKFKEIEDSINRPMTSLEFYKAVCPILKLIGNGHTHVVPSAEAYTKLRSTQKLFPFDLYVDGEVVYILRNNSKNKDIRPGDVLYSVNGVDALTIIKDIANNLTRDGINESMPMTRATERFTTFYGFMNPRTDTFLCEISSLSGERLNVDIQGLTYANIKSNRIASYGDQKNWIELKQPAYTLEFEGETAIMTLRTFSNKEIKKYNKMKSKKWFKQAFAKINDRDSKKLIIDLRDNGGGDEEPTIELFSHLHDKPFQFYKDVFLQERKIPNGKHYDDNISILNIYAKLITKKVNGKYVLKAKGLKSYPPAKEQYMGEVLVLTDAGSFSATGEMTAIIKEHDRAIFIGEEPGGNPNQNTSGAMLILNLPHSKLRAVVPVVVFEMNVSFENSGRGVIPDYPIKNSIQDEINGRDAVMDFAKEF